MSTGRSRLCRGVVGQPKGQLLAERVARISPTCRVDFVQKFYGKDTADTILPLDAKPDFVVDAIDSLAAKLHLIDRCQRNGIALVSSMGAAGKLDPTAVRLDDLYQSHADPFARAVRKGLRKHYGWPENSSRTKLSGVTVVYSEESRRMPLPPSWDAHGFECLCPSDQEGNWGKDNHFHACTSRNLVEGSAVFVTSVFGMVAVSAVVRGIVGDAVAPTRAETGQRLADPEQSLAAEVESARAGSPLRLAGSPAESPQRRVLSGNPERT